MKIGVVTFTDGRRRVAVSTEKICKTYQSRITTWVKKQKHQVVESKQIVWNYDTGQKAAAQFESAGVDLVIFNFCVWSYPDLTGQVANLLSPGMPILAIGNINPGYPGWVAFFASAGTLNEVGRPFGKVLGDIRQKSVEEEVKKFLVEHDPDQRARGFLAAEALHGQRYGEFDGPSMGMYTGHVDQSQWLHELGVHVYHRGQLHLWEMAQRIKPSRVQAGLDWLEAHCGKIKWDKKKLTPGVDGTLARQVRMYLAMKDFCNEEGIDFCGLTGQLDMTEWDNLCIADVQEALLNDTSDWEDTIKKPLICATECDSNGALTMQLMHLLTGTPVLFADLRHYFEKEKVYDLVNSGQHAPWFAKRSNDFKKNWKETTLYPALDFYFRGGGASVQFYAAPAPKVTFGRITRKSGQFQFHLFTGSFAKLPRATEERLAKQTTYEWPHAFARFDIPIDRLRDHYSSNHIHAIIGDHVAALKGAGEALGMDVHVLS